MLRKIRIAAALICFLLITLLFLDFTGSLHTWFGWLAKIQFLPAILALNVAVVAALVVLTLVCGRVYCSVICPLGVFQDIVSKVSSLRRRKKTPLLLFAGPFLASIRSAGHFHHSSRSRHLLVCSAAGTVQLLRTHGTESSRPSLRLGKQCTGLYGRTRRQLCLLLHRGVVEKPANIFGGASLLHHCRHTGLAQRTHLLQHPLSRRHSTGIAVALRLAETAHRHL